jgi:hypothetical protein
MRRYLSKTPRREYPAGVRLVHNFYPGPLDNPGQDRQPGANGFRIWITDEPEAGEVRCYCGWLDGREHYGTRLVIDGDGNAVDRARGGES